MIKVSNEVTVYETNGKESSGLPMPSIAVLSHWNRKTLVVLVVAGEKVTVSASELEAAIKNATNTGGI